jgi:hypothetical protein
MLPTRIAWRLPFRANDLQSNPELPSIVGNYPSAFLAVSAALKCI